MTSDDRVQRLQRPDGNTVAYATTSGRTPTVAFLGGFRSDMTGTKAMALEAWAKRTGRAFVRFDYLGHGQSSGRFEDGTIGRWLDDSLAVLDQLTEGKLVLVGSSMGGWLSLLAARARLERPSQYSPEPSVFTWKLIEEGRDHLLLDKKLALPCPVRLLHGQSDPDVPWEYSLQIAEHLEAPEVITTFIKGGDHRLSTPADLARLIATVEELTFPSPVFGGGVSVL